MLYGPRCQSCGVAILRPDEFGTSSTGVKALDYCRHCYDKGVFLEDLTLEQMVDKLYGPMMTSRHVTEETAKQTARELLKELKRWRNQGTENKG
ncbi:MAG: zinc ribbon domain-containing protein [Deltaproteobacteria bacterium]|nr:zinc ribbon domain-containing protein [Deltaproteobacteria bacterium]